MRCLRLVNHGGFPSKSKQEAHSESVKSGYKPFFVSYMYVCMYMTLSTDRNDLLLNIWELVCSVTGSQRINDVFWDCFTFHYKQNRRVVLFCFVFFFSEVVITSHLNTGKYFNQLFSELVYPSVLLLVVLFVKQEAVDSR